MYMYMCMSVMHIYTHAHTHNTHNTGDFMRGEDVQIYEDITKFSELKKLMEEQLEDYNMEPGFVTMGLVLFRDAIEHGK